MKEILLIVAFFIAGMLFVYLKDKIIKRFKTTTYEKVLDEKTRNELADLYKKGVLTIKEYKKKLGKYAEKVFGKSTQESFQWTKFKKMFYLGNGVEWIKSIKEIIDIRKLTIYLVIIGLIFAYGWYNGVQGKPIKVDIGYGKEAMIKLDGHFLHIAKDGSVYVEDKDGNRLKQISVRDIPSLKRKLAPIGFQLQPIIVAGYGISDFGRSGIEVGAGVSFLRYWKGRLEAFITQRGIYAGTSYKITDNSGIGLGVGKGFKGDNRAIIYFRTKF